jgi:hypothetical protein
MALRTLIANYNTVTPQQQQQKPTNAHTGVSHDHRPELLGTSGAKLPTGLWMTEVAAHVTMESDTGPGSGAAPPCGSEQRGPRGSPLCRFYQPPLLLAGPPLLLCEPSQNLRISWLPRVVPRLLHSRNTEPRKLGLWGSSAQWRRNKIQWSLKRGCSCGLGSLFHPGPHSTMN